MNRKFCQSCGATYDPAMADGSDYFHTCPPILMVRVQRDGRDGLVPLAELEATDVLTVSRAGAVTTVAAGDMGADDFRLGDTMIDRPNARDENLIPTIDADGKRGVRLRAAGAGVRDVPPEKPIPILARHAL